jgi:squalene-hopene/tetraprenyl-beta-curcumene cyclase
VAADEPITLDNVKDPGPIKPDEAIAQSFSLERALNYLDTASVHWQKQHQCFTCHTNYSYLIAAPALGSDRPAKTTVRQYAELLVSERWEEKGPRWPAEVVMTAAVLATGDAASGKLHPLTRKALDRMWTVQRADGGWDWLKCNWPPMESDDHYGVTMALLAVGLAPEKYADTEVAKAGVEKIRQYLAANTPPTLHHRAMIFFEYQYIDCLLSIEDR